MAVAMRMSRGGSKKRPYYKIVIADSRSPRDGKFIERIGSYNPLLAKDDEKRVVLDTDRAKHWLEVGAVPSDRVSRFLDAAGLMKREARNNPNKGKPGEKAQERAEEKAEKAAAAKEVEEEAKKATSADDAGDDAAKPDEAVDQGSTDEKPAEEAATDADTKADDAPSDDAKSDDAKPADDAKADA